jgi:5-methylcytosine-specific restriction endonuclease McrA
MGFRPKGSSTARGYGADWQRVRAHILAAEPLCRFCAAMGRVTAATDVDHIEGFSGLADPKRLDPSNLRPLCGPCHMGRTARQARGKTADVGCDVDGRPLDASHAWRLHTK